jgi:hypothetical protein
MKHTHILILSLLFAIALSTTAAFAGLDWTYGSLSNPDNLQRKTRAIAYATSGMVYVSGIEQSASGHKLIVTKKFSSSGSLLASVTNSYFFSSGTTLNDNATCVVLDDNENVYVLGKQFVSSSRGYDIVLIKYNTSLTQQWKKLIYNVNSTHLNYNERPCKILIDDNNNVYVSGTWCNVTMSGFHEENFVQKYNSSGTLLYSAPIPQNIGKLIYDVTDMCIDNNLNITVCARAKDNNDDYSIMYARVSSSGSLSWKKFHSPNSVYSILYDPEIECTSAGTLYLAAPLNREPNSYDNYVKLATVKLNSSGTVLWEHLTTELHEYADAIKLRLDATNNVYTGCDFFDAPTPVFKNHRIYKLNSSGTLQWIYTSPEVSKYFTFETFSNSALFILFEKSGPAAPVLRKLDAATGNILWSEVITSPPPSNYYSFTLPLTGIAVNSITSEVAYCGNIEASFLTPVYAEEYRWLIKKYGATSPRTAAHEIQDISDKTEINLQVFPNPADEKLNVTWKENNDEAVEITITDINGKVVFAGKHIASFENDWPLEISALIPGVYTVIVSGKEFMSTSKFIVAR